MFASNSRSSSNLADNNVLQCLPAINFRVAQTIKLATHGSDKIIQSLAQKDTITTKLRYISQHFPAKYLIREKPVFH